MENPGAARNVILSYVAFFEEHIIECISPFEPQPQHLSYIGIYDSLIESRENLSKLNMP